MWFKVFSIIFLVFGIVRSQTFLDTSLVCYYPFSGNANDASTNLLNGTPVNLILVEDLKGSENNAYYFNGINSFISLPESSKLKVGFPFSFSCWLKLDKYQVPIFTNDYSDNIYSGILFFVSSEGNFAITVGNGGPIGFNSRHTKVMNKKLDTNQWYHVACVARDFNDIDLYLDGELEDGYYSGSGDSLAYTDGNGAIGLKDQDLNGPPAYFQGTLDEIAFFERALNNQEIKTLFHSTTNQINLIIPNIVAREGDTVKVPLYIDIPENYQIKSIEITIDYPLDALKINDIITNGSLVENSGWLFSFNETDSTTNISGAGSQGISEKGNLFFLEFVIYNNIDTNIIEIDLLTALCNDNLIETITVSGVILVVSDIIKGDVDFDGNIRALDASYILEHLVNEEQLTLDQLYSADVSLDSTVSALDAKLILDYTTGLIDTLPHVPSPNMKHAVGIISIPESVNENNGIVKIPIEVTNSENIISFEAEINYNPFLYELKSINYGAELADFSIEYSERNGKINIAGFGESIGKSEFNFSVIILQRITYTNSPSAISFSSIRWNEDVEKKNVAYSYIDVTTNVETSIPDKFQLNQNYPNPFNPTTTISYSIPLASQILLRVYDILGNEVQILVDEYKKQGTHRVKFNSSNLSSGLYIYTIKTDVGSITKKMALIK
jgi:hypothetical protein